MMNFLFFWQELSSMFDLSKLHNFWDELTFFEYDETIWQNELSDDDGSDKGETIRESVPSDIEGTDIRWSIFLERKLIRWSPY